GGWPVVDCGALWVTVGLHGGSRGGARVFLGTHHPRLDEKGRLVLPARWRDDLADGLVITKGQERCLYVFTRAEVAARAADLQAASLSAKRSRDYSRVLFASAADDVPDKQGRITIPTALREYAGLDRD